jgi:hypothetical protein
VADVVSGLLKIIMIVQHYSSNNVLFLTQRERERERERERQREREIRTKSDKE